MYLNKMLLKTKNMLNKTYTTIIMRHTIIPNRFIIWFAMRTTK